MITCYTFGPNVTECGRAFGENFSGYQVLANSAFYHPNNTHTIQCINLMPLRVQTYSKLSPTHLLRFSASSFVSLRPGANIAGKRESPVTME